MGISKLATRYKELSNPNGEVVMMVVVVLAVVFVVAAAAEAVVVVVLIVVIVVVLVVVVVVVVASAAAVLTGIVPNLIILGSGFFKYLNLLIFAMCVFVLHRRYTNIPCTVAPHGLLSVATHLVTGSGLLQH